MQRHASFFNRKPTDQALMFQRSSTDGGSRRARRHSLVLPSSASSSFSSASNSPLPSSRRARSFHLESSSLSVATQLRIQQLEQVALSISTDSRPEGDVRYVMTVRHASAHAVWRLHRSFDEYHAFQKRLLRGLRHGHVCNASCPWLESFLTSYFPAKSAMLIPLWWDATPRVVTHRRDALTHVLQTLQMFLCTRSNLACPVLSASVTSEVLDFIYGQVVDERHVLAHAMARAAAAVASASWKGRASSQQRLSLPSFLSVCDDDSDVESTIDDVGVTQERTCGLCNQALPERDVYVTRLRCGHRFHDECALPKLNEALKCPTCGVRDDDAQEFEDAVEDAVS
ncbi:hypothetical protein BBJ28_00005586 [Nothophytophthora sp. Chile5]|nr:hypothetical protein BBJ28_00005586 [Nothophytophthora sp. Chile5]